MTRKTLTKKWLPEMAKRVKKRIREMIEVQKAVTVTTDLWTDRRQRSYLGITAHAWGKNPKTGQNESINLLLTCKSFKGRHTDTMIAEHFEGVLLEFGLKNKVRIVLKLKLKFRKLR